ncbi:hypothetical protein ABIF50_010700 [Bradyrhizobium diazoefficiens]
MQDDIAGADEGENRGRDGRHARREQRAAFGALIDREPVLDDLAVGMVEARIDQARAHAFRRLAPAGDVIEEVLAVFGRLEHESGGQEHRRLDGALRQLRIIAIGQHQGFRMQHMVADMGLRRERFYHGCLAVLMLAPRCGPNRWYTAVVTKSSPAFLDSLFSGGFRAVAASGKGVRLSPLLARILAAHLSMRPLLGRRSAV